MTNFSQNLIAARKAKNISQKEMARLLNQPVTTYSGYETQGRQPKFEVLAKIAAILETSIDDLIAGDLDRVLNIPERQATLKEMTWELVGDTVVINLPTEPKEKARAVLAMQTAFDVLSVTTNLLRENSGMKEIKFWLTFEKGDSDNDE